MGIRQSGISNLLEHRLEEERRAGRWQGHVATFNALTYARRPLLRRFIVRLAEQLLDTKGAKSYRSEIYEQTARPRVEFPELTLEKLKPPIAWAAGGILGIAAIFALLLLVFKGDAREAIRDAVLGVFPALVPTAILVAILAWALRFLTVTTTRGAPESDEEFERLFVKLLREGLNVDRHGDKRLVVFIDELDRCSPKEVVATLESLRTFLGVAGCVFIVAADQQALEHALTEEVRHATPADPANPYYSAGNAYLDKIFQYQLAFPPLRPRRLTHYALRLLEGRGEVWKEVDLEDVVSVLLPVHVHSPRRVKVLLNSFALAYATAKARAARGQLDRGIAARGAELAKLVCLRTEFPLFARDLESSDVLPEAVLRARQILVNRQDPWDDEVLKTHPQDLVERALLYAAGKLPVAELLGERFSVPLADATEPEDPDNGQSQGEGRDEVEKTMSTVQVAHALQLVAYLEKTADIPGPRDDLIHLDAAGAVWGLDPRLAQQLEDDALGNRPDEVVHTIQSLEDQRDRASALRLLGARTRESVGTDADNAARALLASVAEAGVSLEEVAPWLISDVDHYRRRRALRAEDLPGAFSVAIAAGHEYLLDELLGRDEAIEQQSYRLLLISESQRLWASYRERLSQVCAAEIGHDSAAASSVLIAQPEDLAADLLRGAVQRASEALKSRSATARKEETDPETRERIESAVDGQLGEIAGLARALQAGERKQLAELALLPLTAIPRGLALEREILGELAPLETKEATLAVLDELLQWERLEIEVELLRALDPELVSQISEAGDQLDAYGRQLWSVLRQAETEAPDTLWDELSRVTSNAAGIPGEGTNRAVTATLARRIDSETAADELDGEFALAKHLVSVRLLDGRNAAGAMLQAVAASAAAPPPPLAPEVVAGRLLRWTQATAPEADDEGVAAADAAVRSGECWVPSPQRDVMRIVIAAALIRVGRPAERPAADQIRTLVDQHGSAFGSGVAAWLEHFAVSPEDAFLVLEPYVSQSLPAELREAVQRFAERLGATELAELCRPAIERAFEIRPSADFLRAAQLAAADEDAIADALIRLFGGADNFEHRERVLSIWEVLDPKTPDARRRLVREVFLPLASGGATSFDLARRHLKLCADPPHGTKEQILDGLAAAAPDEKRAKQMRARMVEVGLIQEKKRKSWLRRALSL